MRWLCRRARDEWGDHAEEVVSPRRSNIRIWTGGRQHWGDRRPVGAFSVRWFQPTESQAVIDEIAWDPTQNGSEDEVRQVINLLAGWPVARDEVARSA